MTTEIAAEQRTENPSSRIAPSTTITVQIPQSLITRTLAAIKKPGYERTDLHHAIIEALDFYCGCSEIVAPWWVEHDEHGNSIGLTSDLIMSR